VGFNPTSLSEDHGSDRKMTNFEKFPTNAPYSRDKLQFAENYIKEIDKWRKKTRKQLREHHCCKDCKVYLQSGCPLEKKLLEALG